MTKKELIHAIKDMPDHWRVSVHCGYEARDPSGNFRSFPFSPLLLAKSHNQ